MPRLSAPPVPTCDLRDLWLHATHRPRSRIGRAANMRPTAPYTHPYPTLAHLAHAVLAQAVRDAEPEWERGGRHPKLVTAQTRIRQFRALIWLSSTDPDLYFWCHLADYPVHVLHRRYRRMLAEARTTHRVMAEKIALPPVEVRDEPLSVAPNGVRHVRVTRNTPNGVAHV